MIRDRGMVKWAGMMLPEHVTELMMYKDKEHSIERPELSEWDLQGIQEEIEVAFRRKCQTLVKTWKDGKVISRGGIIESIDLRTMALILDNPFGTERIVVKDIIDLQCME